MKLLFRIIVAFLALALLATACGSDGPADGRQTIGTVFADPTQAPTIEAGPSTTDGRVGATPPSSSPSSLPAPGTAALANASPIADLDRARIDIEKLVDATYPTMLVEHPDGLVLVAERAGTVRPLDIDTATLGEPVLDISADVDEAFERGLLGMAFSPTGDFVYLSWNDADGATRVDEFAVAASTLDPATRRSVFTLPQPFANHNGGHIAFGPDGYLYIGLGDGGAANDPLGAGQDFDNPLGAMLRIDPFDRTPADYGEYGIPPTNPFVDGGGAAEIFLTGVRNPWRFSFDTATDDLWIADVGQDAYEEINRLDAATLGGQNLGWAFQEGRHDFEGGIPDNYVPPIAEYAHPIGCSVTGGFVYRGDTIANFNGAYLFGDFCTAELWAIAPDSAAGAEIVPMGVQLPENSLVSFAQDADGELYALTPDAIHRIVAG